MGMGPCAPAMQYAMQCHAMQGDAMQSINALQCNAIAMQCNATTITYHDNHIPQPQGAGGRLQPCTQTHTHWGGGGTENWFDHTHWGGGDWQGLTHI